MALIVLPLLGAWASMPTAAEVVPGEQVTISVDREGWGDVDTRAIEMVLRSVVEALAPQAAGASVVPIRIRVSHREGCPVVLYERGPGGEYQVLLHADQDRWHMYAYEFAHEFCHIVSNFDRAGPEVARRNQWFEEALCEAASLYTLERLEGRWRSGRATPVRAEHADSLRAFLDEMDRQSYAQFGDFGTIEAWLRERVAALRADPYQRAENERVARAMLPLFHADPGAWRAIAYMNLHRGDPLATIEEFFHHWHAAAPLEAQKAFIARLSRVIVGDGGVRGHPATAAAEPR